MLVEILTVERGNYRPRIHALGEVQPARDIRLSPRVRGEIIARADAFTPGGFLEEGATILRVDPADYENTVKQRPSEWEQAKADLHIEMGRQKVAQLDFELLGEDASALADRDLVLGQPQLHAAQAKVAFAEAQLALAELDWQRCEIRAPFDAHVIEREVDVGSQVALGDTLGRLVGLDHYWVVATVPRSSLLWIAVGNREDRSASAAQVRDRAAWASSERRQGTVDRLIGSLDGETRLARLVITVADPLARLPANAGKPRLIIGTVLETLIEGREITKVVRLDRNLLHDDRVWLMESNALRIVDVEVVFEDEAHAYISRGLKSGDQVVTTNLSSVADGAPLRRDENPPSSP